MTIRVPAPSRFTRKVAILFSGNAAGQVIPVLLAPAIARLYDPSDYGTFGLYLSIVGLGAVASTGRYELAILLANRSQTAEVLLVLALWLVVGTALAVTLTFGMLGQTATLAGLNPFGALIFLIPIAILLRGAIQAFIFLHTRLGNFTAIAVSKISQGSVLGGVQIASGFAGYGALGLILGSISSYLIAMLVMVATARSHVSLRRARSCRAIRAVHNRYKNFPKYNLPHAMLRASTSNLPVLIMSAYFSDAEVGLYAMCYGVTILPLSLIGQPIFQVFSRDLSARWRNSPQSAQTLARSLLQKIIVVTTIPSVVAVIAAPALFALVLGDQWRASGELFRWLAPMIIISFVSSNFSFIPQLLGGQRKALVLEIFGFLLMIASMVIGGVIGDLTITLILFSTSSALLTAYRLTWYFALLKRKVRQSKNRQLR